MTFFCLFKIKRDAIDSIRTDQFSYYLYTDNAAQNLGIPKQAMNNFSHSIYIQVDQLIKLQYYTPPE